MTPCPPPAVLAGLLADALPPADAQVVLDHVEDCPACQQALDQSTTHDHPPDPADAPPSDDAFLRRLAARPPAGVDPAERSTPDADGRPGPPAPMPPPVIPGYEVVEEVGRGGAGVVFKAWQPALKRFVALKLVDQRRAADPLAAARFRVEAETLAALQHPNIVRVFEAGEADGRAFFAMEYVDGGTLGQWLDGKPQPPRAAAGLVETVARAVHHAHLRGVLHRDIKPANILLSQVVKSPSRQVVKSAGGAVSSRLDDLRPEDVTTPTPKVSDFGLAKTLAADAPTMTRTGAVLGTPEYMAPEQAGGSADEPGPGTDVYGLGAVLYQCLTGRPPFKGRDVFDLLDQVRTRPPAPPRQLAPGVPRDLETVCLKALEKDPRRRYASAEALADDLRRFLGGHPIRARRATAAERGWLWAKRQPVMAALAAAAVLALVGGAGASAYFGVKADAARADAVRERNRSLRQLARSQFAEGRRLAEGGAAAHGLAWMARALSTSPDEPEDAPFREAVRLNLAAWRPLVHELERVVPQADDVYQVAFRPDGRRFATATHDGRVGEFDADTGRPAGPGWVVSTGRVTLVAYTPDGRGLLATGPALPMTRVDAATGRVEWQDAGGVVSVRTLVGCTDGPAVVGGGTGGLWRWGLDTGRRETLDGRPCVAGPAAGPGGVGVLGGGPYGRHQVGRVGAAGPVRWVDAAEAGESPRPLADGVLPDALAVHPAGRAYLAVADGFRPYDLDTGRPAGRPLPTGPEPMATAFTPDGRGAATGTARSPRDGEPTAAREWDLGTGEAGEVFGLDGPVWAAAYSPDGRRLVTAGMSTRRVVRVWAVGRPAAPPTGAGDTGRVRFHSAAFSRDRRAAVMPARNGGLAAVWTAAAGGLARTLPQYRPDFPAHEQTRWYGQAAIGPDGRAAVTRLPGHQVGVWEVGTGRPVGPPVRHPNTVSKLAFSPDGRAVASGDFSFQVTVTDPATAAPLGPPLRQSDIVFDLAFSPDGRRLAVTTNYDWNRRHLARVWEVPAGTQVGEPVELTDPCRCLFSPDGRELVTYSPAGVGRWEVGTGRPLLPAVPPCPATAVAFAPDGRLVVGTRTGQVAVFDPASGRLAPAGKPTGRPVADLDVTADGRLAAAGYEDGAVRLFHLGALAAVGPAAVRAGPVAGVGFTPDGAAVRAAGADGTVTDVPVPVPYPGTADEYADDLRAATGAELTADDVIAPVEVERWERLRADRPPPPPPDPGEWHDAAARDAERAGDAFAAGWHLDRLVALRPADWRLYARRAAVRGDPADDAAAERLGPPAAVAAGYAVRAADAEVGNRPADAARPLDRWAALQPDDWRPVLARAGLRARHPGLGPAAADLAAAVKLGAPAWGLEDVCRRLVERRGGPGLWEAAAPFARAAVAAGEPGDPFAVALVLLTAHDREAYTALCRRVLDRVGDGESAGAANNAAALCALAPLPPAEADRAVRLARSAVARQAAAAGGSEARRAGDRHAFRNTLGTTLVRAGRHREAVEVLAGNVAEFGGGLPYDHAYLALAHYHLGDVAEARRWAAKARGWKPRGDPWDDADHRLLVDEVAAAVGDPDR